MTDNLFYHLLTLRNIFFLKSVIKNYLLLKDPHFNIINRNELIGRNYMKYLFIAISLILILPLSVQAEVPFDPTNRTGNLGSVDPGAIMNYYTNPSVPNTYGFIDPKDVGLQKQNVKDIINVEKKDIFGKIIIDQETNQGTNQETNQGTNQTNQETNQTNEKQ